VGRETEMSTRLKALLIVFQVSALMWGAMIYVGQAIYASQSIDVDMIATASTE
jgi:hypothetical protein